MKNRFAVILLSLFLLSIGMQASNKQKVKTTHTYYPQLSEDVQRTLYRNHLAYHQKANWKILFNSPNYVSDERNNYIREQRGAEQFILTHQDEQCMVAVKTIFLLEDGSQIPVPYNYKASSESAIEHIAYLYQWGRPLRTISEQDRNDVRLLTTAYPADSAKSIFTGASMHVFPLHLKGEYLLNKYHYGRGVVVFGENNIPLILFFFMTDKSISDFNRYLSEFKGVLSFLP